MGKRSRPWRRRKEYPAGWTTNRLRHCFSLPFFVYDDDNMDFDINMKKSVQQVSRSAVSIITHSGGEIFFCGSGTIISCVIEADGRHKCTILSSATLVLVEETNELVNDIKVDVFFCDKYSLQGQIVAVDKHFNLLFITVISDVELSVARLAHLDDSLSIKPSGSCNTSFGLHQNSLLDVVHVQPNDVVITIGRFYEEPYDLMTAAGHLSIQYCNLDCSELLRMNGKITKCGIGGPVINLNGEVIGVSFHGSFYTPFLPINVVLEWWKRHHGNRGVCQPRLGIKTTNLHAAELYILENTIEKFPFASEGVLIEEVKTGSPADNAGIRPEDILVKCSGNTVRSSLQLFEMSWGKAGESLELVVIRPDEGVCLDLSVVLAERGPDEINRWPLSEESWEPPKTLKLSRR